MRVLVACEFSGIVRDAFTARGHDAWSCDLLPCEKLGKHWTRNVLDVIENAQADKPFDLIIAHPPCSYLCNSGVRWLAPGGILNKPRHAKMIEACDFFAALLFADCPRVCVENHIMHKYARDYLTQTYRGFGSIAPQTIQPWQFGHGETKATRLWLRNLPLLKPTNIVSGHTPRVHHASPGPERWKERSRTMQGIADAMAEQWGNL